MATEELLTSFDTARRREDAVEVATGGIELGLGLSIGGCFEDVVRSIPRTCSLPVERAKEGRKMTGDESLRRMEAKRRRIIVSQRSIGSQGSSGLFDLHCHQEQGLSSCKYVMSPVSIPSSHSQAKNILSSKEEKPPDKMTEATSQAKEVEKNMMEEMPCVSTRGEGPNGKFIQGLLYTYGNGVEVRIVCVCHGSFHTPAEFVKHAGGRNVVHPLRHIVVGRPPFP